MYMCTVSDTYFRGLTFDPLTRTLFWTNRYYMGIDKVHVPANGKPISSPAEVRDFVERQLYSITVDPCNR